METIFLLGRLIFLGAVATLFLGIILWKRFKRKSWLIEEFAYNPFPNPEDVPMNLYMGWMPVAYFPRFQMYYFPETLIKDGSLDAAEITRKRVFEYSTWAEHQEFTDRVRESRKSERVEEKELTAPEAVRPLNEWITLEHGERPLWAKFFFMFIAILSVVIFVRLIWAFLTFPY
jgi:hypothetical protein